MVIKLRSFFVMFIVQHYYNSLLLRVCTFRDINDNLSLQYAYTMALQNDFSTRVGSGRYFKIRK